MAERIEFIDVMKGIAIIFVVVGHYCLWMPFIPTIIWSFHMPLFIFHNGFFFRSKSPRAIMKKGFKSYMVPYLIVWGSLVLIDASFSLVSENSVWGGKSFSFRNIWISL